MKHHFEPFNSNYMAGCQQPFLVQNSWWHPVVSSCCQLITEAYRIGKQNDKFFLFNVKVQYFLFSDALYIVQCECFIFAFFGSRLIQ